MFQIGVCFQFRIVKLSLSQKQNNFHVPPWNNYSEHLWNTEMIKLNFCRNFKNVQSFYHELELYSYSFFFCIFMRNKAWHFICILWARYEAAQRQSHTLEWQKQKKTRINRQLKKTKKHVSSTEERLGLSTKRGLES